MILKVTEAKYLRDYKIQLVFNDNDRGIVDLSDFVNKDHRPIFNELIDKDKFAKFKVLNDTITWPNEADLAPEFLKEILIRGTATII